jgi:hypothetical protein
MACNDYRPDHNGECLNCDEWADEHDLGVSTAELIDFETGRNRLVTERVRAAIAAIFPGLAADLARALNKSKPPKP